MNKGLRRTDFQRVLGRGNVVRTPNLSVHILERADGGPGRYGLIVSRKHGGAVQRNRLRRQLRAGVEMGGGPRAGTDCVVVLKAGSRPVVATVAGEIRQTMEGKIRPPGARA